jgi:hypothetical protein
MISHILYLLTFKKIPIWNIGFRTISDAQSFRKLSPKNIDLWPVIIDSLFGCSNCELNLRSPVLKRIWWFNLVFWFENITGEPTKDKKKWPQPSPDLNFAGIIMEQPSNPLHNYLSLNQSHVGFAGAFIKRILNRRLF